MKQYEGKTLDEWRLVPEGERPAWIDQKLIARDQWLAEQQQATAERKAAAREQKSQAWQARAEGGGAAPWSEMVASAEALFREAGAIDEDGTWVFNEEVLIGLNKKAIVGLNFRLEQADRDMIKFVLERGAMIQPQAVETMGKAELDEEAERILAPLSPEAREQVLRSMALSRKALVEENP